MTINALQAEKLLKGSHKFNQLAFSMLLTRLKGSYAKDPTSKTVENCTNEVNAFLGKYRSIMADDYAAITKL